MKCPLRCVGWLGVLGLALLGQRATIAQAQETPPDAKGIEFFEQKIRPVLVQHCYSCHSVEAQTARKLKADLFVDSAEGLRTGGESGPSVVPGKPAESLLLQAMKYENLQMPPAGKLSDEILADFTRWIEIGAPDPRTAARPAKPKRDIDLEQGRKFWSFQPLTAAAPPEVPNEPHLTPIDRFVRAKQLAAGVRSAGAASKTTLIRRAYFDLIGLPPTPEQVDAFVNDNAPDAFAKVIDSLLASQHYGERWGRHWLDAARFAESGGYEFDGFRPGAYHYRDWVIRALNADLPYDEFVRLQLAGDKLLPGYEGAAAVGFLVAGPYPGQITAKTEERIRYDQIDDMMMTIGGSMLGLTLGCVRCHEHKYDPIPQQDYYAIAATLARMVHGTSTLDPDPAGTQQALAQHAAELAARQAAWKKYAQEELPARFTAWQKETLPKLTAQPRWQIVQPLTVAAEDTWLTTTDAGEVKFVGPRRKDGDTYIVTAQTFQKKIIALRLDALTDSALPLRGPGFGGDGSFALGDFKVTARPLDPADASPAVVLKLKPAFAAFEEMGQPFKNAVDDNPGTFWRSNADGGKDNAGIFEIEGELPGFANGTLLTFELKFVAQGLGRFRLALSTEPGVTWAGESAAQALGEIKSLLAAHNNAAPNTLPELPREALVRWFAPFDPRSDEIRRAVDEHARAVPRPNLTDVYTTTAGGRDVFLLRRGEVDNKVTQAQPGFMQVLLSPAATPERWLPKPEAGQAPVDPRVALARWMTDAEQGAGALLARVMVNRLWQHHFGEGLVGTPNDFGAQGEAPSHPELLDYLARQLIEGGWRLKPLHKQLMLSATYQQSHDVQPDFQRLDPENRWLWHFRPRRLEAESIRDALLTVGGSLDRTMYGPSILDNTPRRSVYLRVKRSELIPLMTMFDAPEPTQSVGERISTTVPTQALAMMNSPFVRVQAERLAQRSRPTAAVSLETAINEAYRIALARPAEPAERDRGVAFVRQQSSLLGDTPAAEAQALVEWCHVLLCLNEFVYID